MYTNLFNLDNKDNKNSFKRRVILYDSLQSLCYDPNMLGILSPRRVRKRNLTLQSSFEFVYLKDTRCEKNSTKELCQFISETYNVNIEEIFNVHITPYDILITANSVEPNDEAANIELNNTNLVIYDTSIRCDWVDKDGRVVAYKSTYSEVLSIKPNEQVVRTLTPQTSEVPI